MKYLQITETGYTPCGKWRVVPSEAINTATINRTLTPEAWKRLCNADIWPVTPKSFQRMLDVLADVAAISAAPTPPAELMLSGEPVAWCDADGDFYSGESYPNVWPSAVPLYASPVPAPAVPEEWRKFVGFLAQQTTFPHPAVCICQACTWIKKARALLQSAEVTDNAAADRLLEGE